MKRNRESRDKNNMISTFKHKKMTWIDLESPTADEVKSLMKKYPIHPLVAEELLRPTIRPKVDAYKDSVYLILHFPVFDTNKRQCASCEIDFIIGKNFFITVHYRTLGTLVELTRIFEVDATLGEDNLSKNSGTLFFHIVRQFYAFSMRQIDHIQEKINGIEDEMFEKKASQYNLVRKISHVRRDVLDFRRTINSHKEVFSSLEAVRGKFFGVGFSHYLSNLLGEYYKTWSMVESSRETIESLQETNDSLLSNRTNDIMKVLTIMAFVTFPLMLLTSMFGMNTSYLPIVGAKGDFLYIVGIMVLSTTIMFSFFKHKRWI